MMKTLAHRFALLFRNSLAVLVGLAGLAALVPLTPEVLAAPAGIFTPRGPGGGGGMYSPSISPFKPDVILLSCDMGGVYRSEDGGASWALIPASAQPPGGLTATHLAPKPVWLPGRVYWVTGRNRLCFSEDDGRTWRAMPPGAWKTSPILSLAADAPASILVSTESGVWHGNGAAWKLVSPGKGGPVAAVDGNLYTLSAKGDLLLRRRGGKDWEPAGSVGGEPAALAGRRSGNGDILLAAVRGRGLLLSEDSGKTWRLVKSPYANETLLLLPKNGAMYALQTNDAKTAQLLRSSDNGVTWDSLFRMPPPGSTPNSSGRPGDNVNPSWVQTMLFWGYYFTERGLDVSAADPRFALVTTQGELYATRDGGESWDCIVNKSLPSIDGTPRFASVGLEVTSAWGYFFDPRDSAREYIAYTDVGFARTPDQGQSWMPGAKGSPWGNTFYDVVFDPAHPGRMYAAASQAHDIPHYLALGKVVAGNRNQRGGVVVSDDYGATWRVPYPVPSALGGAGGLPEQICTTIALDPASPPDQRTLYAGIFGEGDDDKAGVYVSRDNGTTWARLGSGAGGPGVLPNLHIYRLRLHPQTGHLYCLITGIRDSSVGGFFATPGGIWKSEDKGATWRAISAHSPLNRWATAFAFDPQNPRGLYVTAASPQDGKDVGGVWKTADDGNTWFHVLNDARLATVAGPPDYDHCMAVTVHPGRPNLVLVGTTLHGLVYSPDNGKTWRRDRAFPFSGAQSITVNPRKPARMCVTTFGAGAWEGPVPQ